MTPDLRDEAVKQLRKMQDFRGYVLVYVLVNAVLWAIWAVTTAGGFPWPVFPTTLWGIGVVMNAWDVYGRRPFSEDQILAEAERLKGTGDYGPNLRTGSDDAASHAA